MEVINAVGRRKAAIARVYLKPKGKGNILVNRKDYKEYFPQLHLTHKVVEPLKLLAVEKNFDITVNVTGGGVKGQVEAVRLGISRALVEFNPEFRTVIKPEGFLKRDPRRVERKKPGLLKARKQTQYRKR